MAPLKPGQRTAVAAHAWKPANQVPEAVAEWVEDMASSWDFRRIIPCHMAAPIAAGPDDLRCTC